MDDELRRLLCNYVLTKHNKQQFVAVLDLLDPQEHHWIDYAGYVCAAIDGHTWRYLPGETPTDNHPIFEQEI